MAKKPTSDEYEVSIYLKLPKNPLSWIVMIGTFLILLSLAAVPMIEAVLRLGLV
jgi:hypothetical protein